MCNYDFVKISLKKFVKIPQKFFSFDGWVNSTLCKIIRRELLVGGTEVEDI
jgi:hypothetical protein